MPASTRSPNRDRLAVAQSFRFIGRHLLLVAMLCAISAGGRFVQTGWASLSGVMAQVALEILVEGARVVLVLAVIGDGNPVAGVRAIKRVFNMSKADKAARATKVDNRFSTDWKTYAWDFALYCGIAFALNLMINLVVALPAAVEITHLGGAKDSSSAVLLLKNLSVIPLTIIFQIFFIMRLWNGTRDDPNVGG